MRQRRARDIWKGLFEFHLVEGAHHITPQNCTDDTIKLLLQHNASIETESTVYKHVLTHQIIYTVFYGIKVDLTSTLKERFEKEGGHFYSLHDVDRLPKPRLIQRYLESAQGMRPN